MTGVCVCVCVFVCVIRCMDERGVQGVWEAGESRFAAFPPPAPVFEQVRHGHCVRARSIGG
jgi:hypothetical protein